MAGGIFGDQPFVLNPKCILFSLMCMALFLYRPSFSHPAIAFAVLVAIFWAAYISMAWYDYYYDCNIDPLRKGSLSLQGYLKPPAHVPEKQYSRSTAREGMDKSLHMAIIYLLHLVFIVPLIGYIAIRGKQTPVGAFWLLGALAFFTAGYHALGAYTSFATST